MQIESLKAENHYVIVQQIKEVEKTLTSGLVIMEKLTYNDLMCGEVKAISGDVTLDQNVTLGTRVHFYEKEVKSRFYLDGVEYLTIKDLDLIAYRSE